MHSCELERRVASSAACKLCDDFRVVVCPCQVVSRNPLSVVMSGVASFFTVDLIDVLQCVETRWCDGPGDWLSSGGSAGCLGATGWLFVCPAGPLS